MSTWTKRKENPKPFQRRKDMRECDEMPTKLSPSEGKALVFKPVTGTQIKKRGRDPMNNWVISLAKIDQLTNWRIRTNIREQKQLARSLNWYSQYLVKQNQPFGKQRWSAMAIPVYAVTQPGRSALSACETGQPKRRLTRWVWLCLGKTCRLFHGLINRWEMLWLTWGQLTCSCSIKPIGIWGRLRKTDCVPYIQRPGLPIYDTP